jgi:hypothetical protein
MSAKLPSEVNALIDMITNDDIESVKSSSKLSLGNLYLWAYDPKHKATLEMYDTLPLVILLGVPKGQYILGINLHYIPWTYRINFLTSIQAKGTKVKYKDIIKAWKTAKIPGSYAVLAIRKYLVSHIKSNIRIFDNLEDQLEVTRNVLPHFEKKSMSAVYKIINNKLKSHRQKLKTKAK